MLMIKMIASSEDLKALYVAWKKDAEKKQDETQQNIDQEYETLIEEIEPWIFKTTVISDVSQFEVTDGKTGIELHTVIDNKIDKYQISTMIDGREFRLYKQVFVIDQNTGQTLDRI